MRARDRFSKRSSQRDAHLLKLAMFPAQFDMRCERMHRRGQRVRKGRPFVVGPRVLARIPLIAITLHRAVEALVAMTEGLLHVTTEIARGHTRPCHEIDG